MKKLLNYDGTIFMRCLFFVYTKFCSQQSSSIEGFLIGFRYFDQLSKKAQHSCYGKSCQEMLSLHSFGHVIYIQLGLDLLRQNVELKSRFFN
jgi:hypothetical protein